MNTKAIARITGKTVAEVNAIARDLQIMARYDAKCRCWRVQNKFARSFVNMLLEDN